MSLLGAAAAALVLAGCAHAQAGEPTRGETPAAVASPSPSPVPTAQALRVPTTCDALLPASVLAEIGDGLTPAPDDRTERNSSWADERVGALRCHWSNGVEGPGGLEVRVAVGPEVTREAFDGWLDGEQGAGIHSPAVAPDAYTLEPQGTPMGFLFLTPHYGSSGYLIAGSDVQLPSDAATRALEQVHGVVAALGAPGPLWVPTPNLRGASDCDSLATASQLGELAGLPAAREVKSDGGEYSTSLFNIDRQVGGYWCTWISDDQSVSYSVNVSVLPGAAESAAKARPAGSSDVTGIGESAYVSPSGVLNVVAAHGWVQVSGAGGLTADRARALAKQVLVNVGYTG
ncbi:hypothetical protein HNO83_06290 [Leifsonia sp. C5G2]|nr:hypothetical protein [Leifsonia sp. C5G2]